MSTERVMPADVGTERALLGALILDESGLQAAAEIVKPKDFYGQGHGRIFEAMLGLAQRGEPIDVNTVLAALGDDVERAGGAAYVSALIDGLPRASNVAAYARVVAKESAWRAMAHLGQELVDRALEADGDAAALATTFVHDLIDVASNGREQPVFEVVDEGRYRLVMPGGGVTLETDYLRREHHQLKGELLVRCPGGLEGVLFVGDLNFSSSRSRSMCAKDLSARAKGIDWGELLEQLAQQVIAAERAGAPDVALHEIEAPDPIEILNVDGLTLPRDHPTVIFGDGNSAKSYMLLYVLGRLAHDGLRVGLADWELSSADHRERLGRLFPDGMPAVRYLRCSRPIVHEADRLRRWVRDQQLDYVGVDSVAYACAGAPENADVCMAFFQVLRQLGIGSACIAHTTKASEGSDRRPFGSTFWFNTPRALWFVRAADTTPGDTCVNVGFYDRKFNVGAKRPAIGFELTFGADRTHVRRVDLADIEDLAARLPVAERMRLLLRRGPMTVAAIADQLHITANTVKGTVRRKSDLFVRLPNDISADTIALAERRAE